jgi:hypothetical protein
MRRRLRASGETAGWGTSPRFSEATILRNINELARSGMLAAGSAHE